MLKLSPESRWRSPVIHFIGHSQQQSLTITHAWDFLHNTWWWTECVWHTEITPEVTQNSGIPHDVSKTTGNISLKRLIWLVLLFFRATTPAYQKAARLTSGNPERRRTNILRRPKKPWIQKTAFLTVGHFFCVKEHISVINVCRHPQRELWR